MSIRPILGYWNIRGLAQPIRFLLEYLDVKYEDKQYSLTEAKTKDNWYKDRPSLDLAFPNLPYLIDGSTKVTESRAIMRHICRERKPALLGATNGIHLKIDMVENFMFGFWYMVFIEMLYLHTDDYIRTYNEQCPVKLEQLSKFIGQNKWVTGEQITYLDFWVYEMLYQFKTFDSKVLGDHQNLKRIMKTFEELPAISSFIKSSRYLEKPLYTATAVYKI